MSLGSSSHGKLRQWLIEQIDSGMYPGLVWENDEKTIFRIPWKHAGMKKDAALFKAWALFKGMFREGTDKPDYATWKARLQCVLNRSQDFKELTERSQLNIPNPYKVYRVASEKVQKRTGWPSMQDPRMIANNNYTVNSFYPALSPPVPGYMAFHDHMPERLYTWGKPQPPTDWMVQTS